MTTETPDPADTYLIGGAAIPTVTPNHPFAYDTARVFQQTALDWLHADDAAPVAALTAPTGSGKTAVIAAVADAVEKTLCVYPTNALVNAQKTALEEYGLATKVVTGPTLSGHGEARAQELLRQAQRQPYDVLITNPDILQAVIQNLYFSAGSRVLDVYNQFGAAVYDEFHYYDELAASGLLMQIKLLSERSATIDPQDPTQQRPPRVVLSSATPDPSFLTHLEEDIGLNIRPIKAPLRPLDLSPLERSPAPKSDLIYTIADGPSEHARTQSEQTYNDGIETVAPGSVVEAADDIERFRYPMVVHRHDDWIEDDFATVAQQLDRTVADSYDGGTPVAAVIFNSAARSNAFHRFLWEYDSTLAEQTVKDNGYDTGADRDLPDSFAILNTTSKGEVGLDFDIERLIMEVPRTATAFVQRIGRAGRQSPAVVDLYGLDDPGWPPVQSYPEFIRRASDVLPDRSLSRERLREIIALRAAWALQDRIDSQQYFPDEIWEDFGDFPGQSTWRAFLAALFDAVEMLEPDSPFAPQLDKVTSRAVRGARNAIDGLDALRGRGIQHQVTYPRGDGTEHTEYDLIRALQHYEIERIDTSQTVHLTDDGDTGQLRGYYPGSPNDSDGIDLTVGTHQIEARLTEDFQAYVEAASLEQTELERRRLRRFFDVMPLESALLPRELQAGRYTITCDLDRDEVDKIDESQ